MRLTPNLVHAVDGKRSPIPARGGKSINWRRLESLTATTSALTEGTPGAATQITWTAVTATVDQYGQYTQLTDLVETQAIDPVVVELVNAMGEVAGNSLDQVVRNVLTAGTNVNFASTGGSRAQESSGMYLSYAEIRRALATLERQNVKRFTGPNGAVYHSIIHPDTKRDMFADTNILTTFQYAAPRDASNPLFQGVIGQFLGIEFMETTNARIFSSAGISGADVYASLFYGQEWFGISDYEDPANGSMTVIVKPLGSAGAADPLNQYGTVGWKAAIVAAILNQNSGVRVEHVTSQKNAA